MLHPSNAPSEADAPRPWARAILHAHLPVALKLLLLALLAAFSATGVPGRALRRPHKDWLLSITTDTSEDPDSDWDPYVLRRLFRLRARLGWLMRCDRAEGMALSGQRAPAPCPTCAARAPPQRKRARNHPESVAETPRPAAMTHTWNIGRPGVSTRTAVTQPYAGSLSRSAIISLKAGRAWHAPIQALMLG
jgi:hypothetical protein